jgi:voltage-gated sodium channel
MSVLENTDSSNPPDRRARLRAFVESAWFRYPILALIFVNAIILGLETSESVMAATGDVLLTVDSAILAVFVVELLIRLYAHGLRFFRDPWSLFDLFVVAVALVPTSGELSVFRALRVLRALRLVSGIPRLRRVVEALLHAVPGIGAIGALLLLIFYVFAVIATKLYAETFPEWFGTIGASMFSLFQIMTLESWSMGIVRPVLELHPFAWLFFITFIVASSFAVLNLFIAIIVDSMQSLHAEEDARNVEAITEVVDRDADAISAELAELRGEVRALRELLSSRVD